mgnify:FL=1
MSCMKKVHRTASKTNILFYPKGAIIQTLAAQYLRLGEINLSIKNNRTLVVAVIEREPLYTWCQTDDCYFLDADGYVFDKAPYFSGNVYFKFYGALESGPLGAYFAKDYFKNFTAIKNTLTALELEPIALELKAQGDAEFVLAGTATPKILFRADADPENIAGNLRAALQTEPLKTRVVKEYSKLEYLDLRFENKVYSKFR